MLVFDIETRVHGKIDPKTDELRFIGLYEIEEDKTHFLTIGEQDKIQALFNKHKIIISYNGINYDMPILNRYGIGHRGTHIDLYQVIKKRKQYLGIKSTSNSMSNIAKALKLDDKKIDDFDYDILKKESYTAQEIAYIKKYTLQDVKVTTEIYKRVEEFFKPLKEYMSAYDQHTMKWITSSIASYAYKVICHQTGIEELYSDNREVTSYEGGHVIEPIREEDHGTIICFDYASLYPNIYFSCNLFSHSCKCCNKEEKWTGDGFFKVKGSYCKKKLGTIEKLLKTFYEQRKEYKSVGDKREYALKIIMNSIYGASGSPIFKSLYNYNTASDCTSIARTCVQEAIRMFNEAGHEVLYGDTDSCYVKTRNKTKAVETANNIVKHLTSHMPIPNEHFELKIDDEIKHMWFTSTGDKLNKKTYIYVTTKGKVVIKGLAMIKSDSSKIGMHVFNKYMKELVSTGNIKFKYNVIKRWVDTELKNNLDLCIRTFKTKPLEEYKSESQLQAQISKKYGPGVHYLITNNQYGVGKGKKYCTVKEYEEQGLTTDAIDLTKFWSEMEMFIKDKPEHFNKTNKTHKNKKEEASLLQWFA